MQRRLMSAQTLAYVFHPKKQTMEADLQMFQWTKTQDLDQAPPAITDIKNRGLGKLESLSQLVRTNIIKSRIYDFQEEEEESNYPKEYPSGLLQNMLKTVFSHANQYPQLSGLNIADSAPVMATWLCQNEPLSVRGRPGTFINSKKPLSQFYDDATVTASSEYTFQSLGPASVYHDLEKYSVKTKPVGGLREGSAFPYFHTLLIVECGRVPEIQLLQKAMVYTFGRLTTQAVHKYGTEIIGRPIPEPECAQCIVTNGQRFSFVWYQLNTLDLQELNSGVKNLACVYRPGALYKDVVAVRGHRKYRVTEFNEDILRTFLSSLLLS